MESTLISYITSRIPKDFFVRLPGELEGAYFQAFADAEQKCGVPEQNRVRGQLRHYYQNKVMREVGNAISIPTYSPHTDPKGERYTLLLLNEVAIGRTSVAFTDKRPPLAKHRKTIAAVNSRLEPTNLDLFSDSDVEARQDGLGVLIVTVHPPKKANQSVPSHFVVGVPFSNLKGWHLFEPIPSILAAYEPVADVKPVDIAFPTLKRQLKEAEDGN